MTTSSIEIFFSYAHEDEDYQKELSKHLKLLERQGIIKSCHDRNITAGEEWKNAIDTHLESAQIILLLISADFLASDYCYDIEMNRALERHEQGGATVIPIIVRAVDWQRSPFGKLQALPKDAKPIATWDDVDQAYTDVVKGIRRVIEAKQGTTSESTTSENPVLKSPAQPMPSQHQENRDCSTGFQIHVSGGTVNINPGSTGH